MSLTVTPIKTPIIHVGDDLLQIIAHQIKEMPEDGVLVVTSKVVSLWEGHVVVKKTGSRRERHGLVKKEAELYLPPHSSKYDLMLAIKHQRLLVNAGIDVSNVESKYYVLLPVRPYESAQKIWQFCRDHYRVGRLGVVISDSHSTPLMWGVFGTALGHCGFKSLVSKIGKKDLFNRPFRMATLNLAESIAGAGVLMMGETNESTPLAVVQGAPDLKFQDRPPSQAEIDELKIELKDDMYYPLLGAVKWQTQKT
ncbi:MAG: coenzyme F420-0:L-glutamate ligase [Patescibacteria group bacterium]